MGTWTTTGVSGTQSASGASVSGGAGQLLTISSDGIMTIDPTGSQPVQLSLEGQTYTVTQAGVGSGSVTTSGGQLTYKTAEGDSLSSTIAASDGTTIGTPAADEGFTASYTCTPGQTMTITENGVTYSFTSGNTTTQGPSPSASVTASPTPT